MPSSTYTPTPGDARVQKPRVRSHPAKFAAGLLAGVGMIALAFALLAGGDGPGVPELSAQNPARPVHSSGKTFAKQIPPIRNVVLIVLDGIRTEEFFIGINPYAKQRGASHARDRLFPFLWGRLAANSAGSASAETRVFGDRFGKGRGDPAAQDRRIDNTYGISLPAYADLLGGVRQIGVRSNKFDGRLPNPTVPDRLLKHGLGDGDMAIFSSWKHIASVVSAMPPVGFHVDTGRKAGDGRPRWKDARFDRDLQKALMAHLRERDKRDAGALRFLFVAYNDSDEWAHIGNYGRYIQAIRRQDAYIRELYNYLENQPGYRGQTLYIVTTDHGRGRGRHWKSHGRVPGSQYVWALLHAPGQAKRVDELARVLETRCSHTALGALAFTAATGGEADLAARESR